MLKKKEKRKSENNIYKYIKYQLLLSTNSLDTVNREIKLMKTVF